MTNVGLVETLVGRAIELERVAGDCSTDYQEQQKQSQRYCNPSSMTRMDEQPSTVHDRF